MVLCDVYLAAGVREVQVEGLRYQTRTAPVRLEQWEHLPLSVRSVLHHRGEDENYR